MLYGFYNDLHPIVLPFAQAHGRSCRSGFAQTPENHSHFDRFCRRPGRGVLDRTGLCHGRRQLGFRNDGHFSDGARQRRSHSYRRKYLLEHGRVSRAGHVGSEDSTSSVGERKQFDHRIIRRWSELDCIFEHRLRSIFRLWNARRYLLQIFGLPHVGGGRSRQHEPKLGFISRIGPLWVRRICDW